MKKINPMYILALLLTLLFVSMNQLQNTKQELIDENKSFEELKIKANIYNDFKNVWLDKKVVENKLNKIKNNPIFKNEKIEIKTLKNSYEINFVSINRTKQSNFINMILNDMFIIKNMNFNKDNLVIEVSVK